MPSSYVETTYTIPATSGTKLDGIDDNATRNQVFQQASELSGGTYAAGDIWIDTDDNYKSHLYDGTSWNLRADQRIQTALDNAATAQSTADGKIETFYQDAEPASADEGDLWIDTNDDNKLYRYDGSAWQAARDLGIAEAIQDAFRRARHSRRKGYYLFAVSTSTPTAEGEGDLWYQTDTRIMKRWSGSAWQEVASYNTGALADQDTVGTGDIDDDAVTNVKLADDSVSLANIIAGTTSVVNPVTQTQNVYRWAGYDSAGNVVNAIPAGITVEYDTTEKALELRNDGNVAMRSDTFVIDQNSIYKITLKAKKDSATGNYYIGAFSIQRLSAGQRQTAATAKLVQPLQLITTKHVQVALIQTLTFTAQTQARRMSSEFATSLALTSVSTRCHRKTQRLSKRHLVTTM